MYILFHHTKLISVLPHSWSNLMTLGKTNNLDGALSTTTIHTHTHIHMHTYTLFHHTGLTSVLQHRWPSFTTLGKPTFWMVTYLSITILYTHMYTHTHTYILFVLQIDPHHTYIYRHIYSASPHRVKYLFYRTDSPLSYIYILSVSPHRVNICFTTQMAQFYHIGETDNLDGDLSITISYTHLYTPTHKYTVCFTDSLPSYISIYILIYSVSPHRVKYLFYRTDRLPSCIYIHIYSVSPHIVNICFTTQMAQFYHTGETNNLDGDLSITILYTHMYRRTHIYCLFYR